MSFHSKPMGMSKRYVDLRLNDFETRNEGITPDLEFNNLNDYLDQVCARGQWQLIGEGSYGQVYKCSRASVDDAQNTKQGIKINKRGIRKAYALKLQTVKTLGDIKNVERENATPDKILNKCRDLHLTCQLTNVISSEIVYLRQEKRYVYSTMMELANAGSAYSLIKKQAFDWTATNFVREFAELVNDLYASYEIDVLHRDIKPDNILVQVKYFKRDVARRWPYYQLFLADFGLACDSKGDECKSLTGTLYYMDPVVLLDRDDVSARENESVDVYALGVTLFEILTQTAFYRDSLIPQQFQKLYERSPLTQQELSDLTSALLINYNQQEHFLLREFLPHFLSDYKNKQSMHRPEFVAVCETIMDMCYPTHQNSRPSIEELFKLSQRVSKK